MAAIRPIAISALWLLALAFAGAPGIARAELAEAELAELEVLLARLKFQPGHVDGVIDERTRTAIRLYQEFAALPTDGIPTEALLMELRAVVQAIAELKAAEVAERTAGATTPAAPPEAETAAPTPAAAPEAETAAPTPAAPPEAEIAAPTPAAPPAAETAVVAPDLAPADLPPALSAPISAAENSSGPSEGAEAVPAAGREPEPLVVPQPKRAPVPRSEVAGNEVKTGADGGVAGPTEFSLAGVIARLVESGGGKRASDSVAAKPESAAGANRGAADPPPPGGEDARTNGYSAFRRGFASAQAGDFDAAIDAYTRAIDSGHLTLEHRADAFFNRANAYHAKRLLDLAIADYDAAIGHNPNFAGAYYNRGFSWAAKGMRERAVADFAKARGQGMRRSKMRLPDVPSPLL